MLLAPAPESPPRAPSPTPGAAPSHRNDIQVLRAVAVVLVVLYHLNVPGFASGFIGVDVFFVISGYLISRLLLVEVERSGGVDLGRFVARRVRRLLPMSFVVLVTTLVLIRSRLGPLEQLDAIEAGEAAATYRINFTLAQRGTDYLTADLVSPFQHYWSLAIEEQFYVLLPITIWGLARLFGRSRLINATALTFALVGIVTLLLALRLSSTSPPEAFFLLRGNRTSANRARGLSLTSESGVATTLVANHWDLGAGLEGESEP